MAANVFTLEIATPHQQVYSWDNAAGPGALSTATLIANAVPGPLKAALQAIVGQIDTDAKAVAALQTGKPFTGAGAGTPTIETDIQSTMVQTLLTAGKSTPALAATAVGLAATLNLTSDTASGTGLLYITHRWSPTV